MKTLRKKVPKVRSDIRKRTCYCGALCTCYRVKDIKNAYGAKAVGWSSGDVDLA